MVLLVRFDYAFGSAQREATLK